ncbi:MAG: hypothetical protein CMO55_05765 [Verrucomicrobiales bacterium]|nr:hypothetical protein [Verrucomicrobiales bacterium]
MKAREKRLLFALLGLVVLGVAVICSDIYFDKRDELEAERENLDTEWVVIETLFEEREVWELRADWLENNQPAFTTTEQMEGDIFQTSEATEVEGVTTSKKTLLPTQTTQDYVQVGVSVVANGNLPSVFRWLYDLTRPDSFRVIRNFKVAPDKENEGQIIAQFDLLRWYAPPNR